MPSRGLWVEVGCGATRLLQTGVISLDFAGTQEGEGRIHSASEDLEGDSVIYSHTEKFSFICAGCCRALGYLAAPR